jgi:hypothetical protein
MEDVMNRWIVPIGLAVALPIAVHGQKDDLGAAAAKAAGEPGIIEIAKRAGYTLEPGEKEVNAQRFIKAGSGPVKYEVLASWGLEKPCHGGWYRPGEGPVKKEALWTVNQKKDAPTLEPGSRTEFDPGAAEFGLYVNTEGFPAEIVTTEDSKLEYIPRFKANDKHKAHVYPARKDGKEIPHTYLIGWEYSTNNDNQDIVTLVSNVKPVPGGQYAPKK